MKAWKLEKLGGKFSYVDVAVPEVRAGGVLIRVEAQALMSYLKNYVEGKLAAYRAPENFVPGGNAIGVVEAVATDVWHVKKGQRVVVSSHVVARENVREPGQILLGITSLGGAGDAMQSAWKDGTLAEYAMVPAECVTPIEGLDEWDAVELAAVTRCVVPYGGLVRGRLAARETVIVNGATGAYGSAAVLVALAMGASRVVVAGRNKEALAELGGFGRVVAVALTGDVQRDAAALRQAAHGGAHLAFDMVGGATDANSTMAALGALYRGGRLVLMGSSAAPLPINYTAMMLNNLEILGTFMYPRGATAAVLEMVRSGQLKLRAIKPKVFSLAELESAMEYATKARSLEVVVVKAS